MCMCVFLYLSSNMKPLNVDRKKSKNKVIKMIEMKLRKEKIEK